MLYRKTGTFEIKDFVKIRMASFWCKILFRSKNKSPYIMYKLLRKDIAMLHTNLLPSRLQTLKIFLQTVA